MLTDKTAPNKTESQAVLFQFLHATAVPGGTAERVLAMGILSVCLSGVSRPGTESSPGQIETPGFHHMLVYNEVIWWRFPSNEGIKEGYPLKKSLFHHYWLVQLDKVFEGTNIDDLERP